MAAGFPAKTSFTDGSVLPASDLNDLGGTINKVYNAGTYPNQLSYTATDSVLRPIPFATSTNKVAFTTNVSAQAGTGATITFASSTRFTQIPIITISAETLPSTAYAATNVSTVTTSGFTWRIFNVAPSGGTAITSYFICYHAIQMTSAAADNN